MTAVGLFWGASFFAERFICGCEISLFREVCSLTNVETGAKLIEGVGSSGTIADDSRVAGAYNSEGRPFF